MNKSNKNLSILLLFCFCVLSINTFAEVKRQENIVSIEAATIDVSFNRPSTSGAQDASIIISVKGGTGSYKVIAVSNTSLGTFTKEGDSSKIVLDRLYAGFYKLYIIDSTNTTTEYQITID